MREVCPSPQGVEDFGDDFRFFLCINSMATTGARDLEGRLDENSP